MRNNKNEHEDEEEDFEVLARQLRDLARQCLEAVCSGSVEDLRRKMASPRSLLFFDAVSGGRFHQSPNGVGEFSDRTRANARLRSAATRG